MRLAKTAHDMIIYMKTLPKPAVIPNSAPTKIDYSKTFVIAELNDMLATALDDSTIKSKAQLFKNRPYSAKKFSEWNKKYEASPRIQELLKKIEEIIESRLIEQGLTSHNYGFVIFLLKNFYGYQDKREVETETTHIFKVSRGDIKGLKANKVVIPSTTSDTHVAK